MNTERPNFSKKRGRELQVLMGLVELYLETGKPVGSNTLKEHGFQALSSATLRNYFAELEKEGYLRQPHASGGRIPTQEALKLYAAEHLKGGQVPPEHEEMFRSIEMAESRNLLKFLQTSAETFSEVTGLATFLSSARFDHDLILEIKLVGIDVERLLCVLITDFGQILTEILPIPSKLSSFAHRRIESYLQWKIKGGEKPDTLSPEEEGCAQTLYNEIMVRYLVRYSNFSHEEIYRTGFSHLLRYPEFSDPLALTTGLSLFENPAHMRQLLSDCVREGDLCYWIGSDLATYASSAQGCAVIAIPYHVGTSKVGAIGVLGPCRLPYSTLIAELRLFAASLSKALTKSLLKYKLSFRQPRTSSPYLHHQERAIVDQTSYKLLERKETP